MPTRFDYSYTNRSDLHREAERQVLKKFPNIIVGSSGWYRAVRSRFARLL